MKINKGTVDPIDPIDYVPPEDWRILLLARRTFVRTKLSFDCRQLVRFVEEAERMFEPLGFASVDDLVRRGLEIDPELVSWAIAGLQKLDPKQPVPLDEAVERGRRLVAQTPPAADEHKREQARSKKGTFTRSDAADVHGSSRSDKPRSVKAIARLKRDRDRGDEQAAELLSKVEAGEIKPNRAAVLAGFRKPPRPETQAVNIIKRIDDREALERIAEAIATRLMEIG